MTFSESIRGQLNRWVNRNMSRIVESSTQNMQKWGRHAVIQNIAMTGGHLQLGSRRILTPDQCDDTVIGRKLRNKILSYNPKTESILVFEDVRSHKRMTIVLSERLATRTA